MSGRVTTAALTVSGVLLTVLTAGCGGSHEDLPATNDPVAWAGRLCDSLQPLSELKNDTPDFNRNNPAESRQAMSQYFQKAADAAATSLRGLDQVGPSPIAGGDQVANNLRGALTTLRGAYTSAKTKVDSVDPSDPVGMGTQLPGILTDLADATANIKLGNEGNPALNDAVKKSPSCTMLGINGTPGGATAPGGN